MMKDYDGWFFVSMKKKQKKTRGMYYQS